MLTLYFSPGACSMASHIALEEVGAAYTAELTLIAKDEQKTEAYLKLNPRGKVPALIVDGKVLVESTAILTYVAKEFPKANMFPADPFEEARCISHMAWFASTVHPSYQRYAKTDRFAEGEPAIATVKETGRKNFWANCQEINSILVGKDWIMGKQYTVADPYALVFYGWGVRAELPMKELAAYTAWKERMLRRPAVRTIVNIEQKAGAARAWALSEPR